MKALRIIIPYIKKEHRWFWLQPRNQEETTEQTVEFLERVVNGRPVLDWETGIIWEHAGRVAMDIEVSPKEKWDVKEFDFSEEEWEKNREKEERISQKEAQTACESILRSVRKMKHNDVNMELFWRRLNQVKSYINHAE